MYTMSTWTLVFVVRLALNTYHELFVNLRRYSIARDPSTFSEGDWRHSYVGFEGPSTF